MPYGSEDTLNVRQKNVYENALLNSEDQRYEYDLYTNRLKKAAEILDKVVKILREGSESEENSKKVGEMISRVIDLGVIQIIYKNASREQKEELEWHLKSSETEVCSLFRDKIISQLH